MTDKSIFSQLTSIDVNDHIDKKETGKDRFGRAITLSYLSWAWAWDYFKKACPDAKYEIRHWDNRPYLYDENLGYMVETSITANGETHAMWLPVMDGTNSAMKATQQTFAMKRKDGTTYNKVVAPATMFDINKTIMRCLGWGYTSMQGKTCRRTMKNPKLLHNRPMRQHTTTRRVIFIPMIG